MSDANASGPVGGTSIWRQLAPSRTLLKFASEIAGFGQAPALDVACGLGRNAILLAAHGRDVVCLDRDLSRLRTLQEVSAPVLGVVAVPGRPGSVVPVCAMVNSGSWPFRAASFGSVISVHFVDAALFADFATSLIVGGYLYIETFGGQGDNYLDLPFPGQIRAALSSSFTLQFYREKRLPRHPDAVTVRALARKRD